MPKRVVDAIDRISGIVFLALALLSAVAIAILIIVMLQTRNDLKQEVARNSSTRDGVCAVRENFEARLKETQKLLESQPNAKIIVIRDDNGHVVLRAPRTLIESDLTRDKVTVTSLKKVDCRGASIVRDKEGAG